MGKKSGPDNSGINQAAMDSAELSKESLAWFKQEYANTAPDRAAAAERQNAISDAQLEGMQFATEQARQANQRTQTVFQPLEDKILAGAEGYDTAGRRMQASNEARASVESNFGAATDGLNRNLQRVGVNTGDGRYLASMRDGALAKATAITGATSTAEKGVEAQGYARMQDAAALGKGLVGNQATQQQIASSTGGASAGAAGAALGSATSGAGLMQTGFGQAMQGMGQSGQLYGQAAGIDAQTRGQDLGFITNAMGMFKAASDINLKKKTGTRGNPDQALAEIQATPVDKDWEYDPAKGGPDDGGQPHTGPMAQDVNATMGEAAAPGGKVIDLVTMNGKLMLGMQALAKRMDQLEQRKAA